MKLKILAGLVTALIYGNAAMAQDVNDTNTQGQESPDNIGGSGLGDTTQDELIILDQEDVAPVPDTAPQGEGVGGSGQAGQNMQPKAGIPMQQGGVTLYCTPVQGQATGGSGDLHGSLQRDYDVQVGEVDDFNDDAFGGSGIDMEEDEGQRKGDMRGLTVMVGAGVEGYTGGLAPEINPGATVGVLAAIKPSKVLGLELGYSGAVNNLDADVGGSGPDIVRNGAVANLTLGLAATPVQPYVLGGFGMNWYNIRNGGALGFTDDTSSRIPVGVGLRTHIGDFTADARVNYNVLLSEGFAPVDNDQLTTGSYQGTLNLGGTF